MKVFIINLPNATERKTHMIKILEGIPNLEINWVEAIDGNVLKTHDLEKLFEFKNFIKNYRRTPLPGEIGCVLSHRKCYRALIESRSDFALIFEDDIFLRQTNINFTEIIQNAMPTNLPAILLLSGWFWYSNKRKLNDNFELCNVFDARLAQSYVINRKAAEILLSEKPKLLADDWGKIRKKSIKILSLIPHITEQNFKGNFKSYISCSRSYMFKGMWDSYIKEKMNGFPRRFLKLMGRFYPPNGLN